MKKRTQERRLPVSSERVRAMSLLTAMQLDLTSNSFRHYLERTFSD
jgi:hypothetical protein